MQSLTEVMTHLSLSPFDAVSLAERGSLQIADRTLGLNEALNASPTDGAEGSWAPCDTCSDPGPDDFDPLDPQNPAG